MRTVRRLYFYAVSLTSLEVVIWGVVGLLRNIANLAPGATGVLANGLALVLVGVPVFLIHWNIAQREAYRDDEERASRVRAVFFYGALLAALLPVVYGIQAILNRLFYVSLGLDPAMALAGRGGSTVDNLIAIGVNLGAAAYFLQQLGRDWRASIPGNYLGEVRRLYRYTWMLYGLVLLVVGVRLVLYFVLYLPTSLTNPAVYSLGNGLALVFVGAPLWVYAWLAIQNSLYRTEEQRALLRLVVLYLLSLAGVITTLSSAGPVLSALIRRALGEYLKLAAFIGGLAGFLATLAPAAVVWAYYSRQLSQELQGMPEEPRRAGLRRLYYYLLALLGNLAVFGGIQQALAALVQVLFESHFLLVSLRTQLGNALAALILGLPLWLVTWSRMQAEAARQDDRGDHARRSAIRKGYLYLVLFLSVGGAMLSGGTFLYLLFSQLLGRPSPTFLVDAITWLETLALVVIWLLYHLRALRHDNRLALRSLGDRHAAFPVLIIQAENESFTVELVQALQRATPRIPIMVHRLELGAPGENLLDAKVVVLPAWLAMKPGESMRLWLNEFQGQRLLVPRSLTGWIWLGALPRDERDLARETAAAVRQLAEGQEVTPSLPNSPWAIAGAILGGIFGLLLLVLLVSLVVQGMR